MAYEKARRLASAFSTYSVLLYLIILKYPVAEEQQMANQILTTTLLNILKTFVPGYDEISKVVLDISGIDIGTTFSIVFIIVAFGTALKKGWEVFLRPYLIASIYIYENDPLFERALD